MSEFKRGKRNEGRREREKKWTEEEGGRREVEVRDGRREEEGEKGNVGAALLLLYVCTPLPFIHQNKREN
jgi:hypothetical protein